MGEEALTREEGKWATRKGYSGSRTVKGKAKQSRTMRNNMRHAAKTLSSSVIQSCQSVSHKEIGGR